MLIIAIITGLIGLAGGIGYIVRKVTFDGYDDSVSLTLGIIFWVFVIIWGIAFLISINLSPGIQHYTGYVYSTSNTFGYTTASIRYSQNAGVDNQPSVCVKSDSPAAQELVAVAGTQTKVNITVPSYFYFANNPFACGTTKTTVEKL